MEVSKTIKGYEIYIGGTWCEVVKDGEHVFDGNVEEGMTPEQVYQILTAKLEFRLNGEVLYEYTLYGTFEGERQATLELLAERHQCKIEDIEVVKVIDTDI